MNPELERLLVALAARDNASPAQFADADAEVEQLLKPILERLSPPGRADFLRALQGRYRAYLRASQRPPTMPSTA
ncbi:MAG: hypothetical protein HYY24_28270 [Verrucomicrobia bacterium]|nr:hypothetical protein [Verrucomicrobiota bacterium]